jgi:hypothetical protein
MVSRWLENPQGLLLRTDVSEPQIPVLWERREEIFKRLESWKRTRRLFKSDEVLSKHYEAQVGIGETRNILTEDHIFRHLLTALWHRTGSLQFDERVFDGLYSELEEFFNSDTVPVRIVAPIQNVASAQSFDIADGVFVDALPPLLAAHIEEPFLIDRGDGTFSPRSASALYVRFQRQKGIGPERTSDFWPTLDMLAKEHIQAIVSSLESLARAHVAVPCYVAEYESWAPIGGNLSSADRNAPIPPPPQLSLSLSDIASLRAQWGERHGSLVSARKPVPPPVRKLSFPDIPYALIYRANVQVGSPVTKQYGAVALRFHPGPITFPVAKPKQHYGPSVALMTLGAEQKTFLQEDGPYGIIATHVSDDQDVDRARLLVAEGASLVHLGFPGLLVDALYEGPIGGAMFAHDGPFALRSRPATVPETVISQIDQNMEALGRLDTATRQRFQLVSRWYDRGLRAVSLVDKLLYFWVALEIHPTGDDSDVPRRVTDYLLPRVGKGLDRATFKERLRLSGANSLVDLRNRIVHQGVAHVPRDELNAWMKGLQRLEAIAATCLRLLGGLPPGDDLKTFLEV